MNINERIELLVKLGEYFTLNNDELQLVKQKAKDQNAWFSIEFIDLALQNIRKNYLQKNLLTEWTKKL